ncbi:hypothetical protein CENSYa_0539 [Cenarchaeum symbiosum A]|uniref:Uncharacterized protein n=1 Tax=Cenarchaeum symbiosum (strain A) TaxID=414004 RepID=A0RV05_CENSY|nr:hypothetical protein CENSYa_0539 [Cenarchaeum symbiosum A]
MCSFFSVSVRRPTRIFWSIPTHGLQRHEIKVPSPRAPNLVNRFSRGVWYFRTPPQAFRSRWGLYGAGTGRFKIWKVLMPLGCPLFHPWRSYWTEPSRIKI